MSLLLQPRQAALYKPQIEEAMDNYVDNLDYFYQNIGPLVMEAYVRGLDVRTEIQDALGRTSRENIINTLPEPVNDNTSMDTYG
jgi:hypothetical protein